MNEEMNQLRRMAIRRIAETSLRHVAKEVGLSPSGLQKFVDGADPYSKTVAKLRAWRTRHAGVPNVAVHPDDADSALRLLTHGLDQESRRDAVLDALERFDRAYGETPPPWLAIVRERWQPGVASAQ